MQMVLFPVYTPFRKKRSVKLLLSIWLLVVSHGGNCYYSLSAKNYCVEFDFSELVMHFLVCLFSFLLSENSRSINSCSVNTFVTSFMFYIIKLATKGLKFSENINIFSRDESLLGANSKLKP